MTHPDSHQPYRHYSPTPRGLFHPTGPLPSGRQDPDRLPVRPRSPSTEQNWLGTLGLVLGVMAFPVALDVSSLMGFLLGLAAMLFSSLGKIRANNLTADNRSMSSAGLLLGGTTVLLTVILYLVAQS